MSNHDQDEYYERWSNAVEADDFEIKIGTVRRGQKLGKDLVLAATGASNEEDALAMFAPGRPRVGHERGVSPSIRARVPHEVKDRLASLAKREKKNESELVRLAVVEYLKTHAA